MKQIVLKNPPPLQTVELSDLQIFGNEEHFLIGLEAPNGRRFIVKLNNYFDRKWQWFHPSNTLEQGSTKGDVFKSLEQFLEARIKDNFKVYFWSNLEYKEYLRWLADEAITGELPQ